MKPKVLAELIKQTAYTATELADSLYLYDKDTSRATHLFYNAHMVKELLRLANHANNRTERDI